MISSLQNTKMNDDHSHISILSMNLLAPIYVRPIDKRTGDVQPFARFDWVKDDTLLEWDSRKLRLMECLTSCQAQVICVQEFQLERNKQEELTLPEWLTTNSILMERYTVILPPQAELEKIAKRNVRVLDADAAVTCAIFVDTKNWKIIEQSEKNQNNNNNNTCVSVCLRHATRIDVDPLVVSSLHLDASDEQKRISLLAKCLERARTLVDDIRQAEPQQGNGDTTTICSLTAIMAGDMNAEFHTGSCMSAILKDYDKEKVSECDLQRACAEALRLAPGEDTPSKQQLDKWKMLQKEAYETIQDHCVSINRVDTGPTRCAYEHATSTVERQMETWKLDHMLYTDDRLVPMAKWATLEADSESCRTGLPNNKCPSDHLPIATVFAIQPTCSIDTTKRQQILNNLQALCTQHKQTINDTEATMDAKLEAMAKQLAAAAVADGSTFGIMEEEEIFLSRPKKKNKKKKEVPPKEIIELTREKRALLKQLKKDQESERERAVQQLSNMERLLIKESFGVAWRKWVKSGS